MATIQDYWNHPLFEKYRPLFCRALRKEIAFQREFYPDLSDSRIRRLAIDALQADLARVIMDMGQYHMMEVLMAATYDMMEDEK